MTFDMLAISAFSAIAIAVLAFLPFFKQADLRPVPVRRNDVRVRRNRR